MCALPMTLEEVAAYGVAAAEPVAVAWARRRVRFSESVGRLPGCGGRGAVDGVVARWGVAVAVSAAGFALAWWVCQELIGLDEGAALGIAGAVLAVVLAVAGWWAARDAVAGEQMARGRRLVQKARAGRDVNMAGRDQTIINDRRRDE